MMDYSQKETTSPLVWAQIDLSAIAHNVRELRRITNQLAQLMVAVKAEGYGHGAVQVARTALENGADQLGVARIEEGIKLRRAGIRAPILILGYTPHEMVPQLIEHQLMPTIYDMENAKNISTALSSQNLTLACHIKIDSGMGRLGVPCKALRVEANTQAVKDICYMARLPGLDVEGVFTHFATADHGEKDFAELQFSRFTKLLGNLESSGLRIPIKHAANSGAIIDMPDTHLDMVRAGISVYGLYPSQEVDKDLIDLHPAMQLKARIIHLKKVPSGTKISYGGTHVTTNPTTIATIPVGYGDGYSRLLSNRGQMLVRGERASIVGRVCMDLTMLDVGHIDNVQVGDEVVMIGNQGQETIPADEVADQLDTINYEVVTALTSRVPRIYTD